MPRARTVLTLLIVGGCQGPPFDPYHFDPCSPTYDLFEDRFTGSWQGAADGNSWSIQFRADNSFRLRMTRKDGRGDCVVPGTWLLRGANLGGRGVELVLHSDDGTAVSPPVMTAWITPEKLWLNPPGPAAFADPPGRAWEFVRVP